LQFMPLSLRVHGLVKRAVDTEWLGGNTHLAIDPDERIIRQTGGRTVGGARRPDRSVRHGKQTDEYEGAGRK
ncbi:hypothetical protein E4U53_001640, partial [Claviceps sorghi]